MIGSYSYTPYIWIHLISILFTAALSYYGWRRRGVSGALPFSVLMLFLSLWALGSLFETTSTSINTKIFWHKFQFFCQGPLAVASLWFVLAYAHLDRHLTRRIRILLILFPIVGSILILTNNTHHWIWLDFLMIDGSIESINGSFYWILVSTGFLLTLLNLPILIWLFIRSPEQRWPVAFIFFGQLIFRVGYVVDILNLNFYWSIQLTFVGFITLATTYAIALFGFHIFDPVAIAHKIVIEQMQKGMLVIDRDEKIIDMNPVAEKILGLSKAEASGKKVDEVLARSIWGNGENQQTEIRILVDKALHYFELNHTPILDKHGSLQGHLILLHDVTFQKLVQKQTLEQQRALGSLEERQHLARELHDQLAQELAFINLQAQAACSMLESDQTTQAKAAILHLAEIARQTQIDVRELISFLIEPGSTDGSFLATIHQTVVRFNQECGIKVQLHLPSDSLLKLDPVVEVQLLRIIQEGLTNIRKHANAQQVQLTITPSLNQFDVVIEDDGVGFDQDELASGGGGYGLNIMRDRAIAIDGDLQIVSAPGEGARICIRVPLGSDTIEG